MPPRPGDSTRKTLQNLVTSYAEKIKKQLPKRNNRTGLLKSPLNQEQHPNFIYSLPNPTIHGSKGGSVANLDPAVFQGLGAFLVVFAPDIFWAKLVGVKCPLCKGEAKPHGWCPQLRRVCGLDHTYFVLGRRYKCRGCPGEFTACETLQLVQVLLTPKASYAVQVLPYFGCL